MSEGGALILARVRELVEQGWSQGSDARDGAGAAVEPWSPAARSWSLLGALVVASELAMNNGTNLGSLRAALVALAELIDEPLLAKWNDESGRTQAEVVATVESARRLCLEA